jgi:hypothetical protein
LKGLLLIVSVLVLLSPLLLAPDLKGSITVTPTSYSWNMLGPDVSRDPTTGNTIRLTGGGTFDTSTEIVSGGGSYQINSSTVILDRGTWSAKTFTSFVAFGGSVPGLHGGVLFMTVTLQSTLSGATVDSVMKVTCLLGTPPPGFVGEEGTTVLSFTESIDGTNLLHTTCCAPGPRPH